MGRFLLLGVALLVLGAGAGTGVEVVLQDGQIFTGEKITHANGLYLLDQGPRGVLTIPAQLVRTVRAPDVGAGSIDLVAIVDDEPPVEATADEGSMAPVEATPLATVADAVEDLPPPRKLVPIEQDALATWYGSPFDGKPTASGDTFDMNALTAAHATLPFGSVVVVTNLSNGLEVELTINDRVPRGSPHRINLSRAAAEKLDMVWNGRGHVRVDLVEP